MQNQDTDSIATRELKEAKLLLVGQGGVGKTSIIKRLTESHYSTTESITRGISIKPWSFNVNEKSYRLNVWDFGGQEIMHATHQFFLTERSLYILVIDARLGERENGLEYWLKIIESFGGDSPVIIVVNKIDQHQLELDKRGLKSKYKNIVEIIETSCVNKQGIDKLEKIIKETIGKLPHVGSAIPQTWLNIRSKIENTNVNFIRFIEFQSLCNNEGVNNPEEQKALLTFLHDLGVVFHYKDEPRLENTNILNPNWVTSGVYAILNSRPIIKNKGILHIDQLHHILDQSEYPKETHLFIIDIMRKFELCFELEGSNEQYLIPELLPKEEPSLKNLDGAISLEYHYNILPRSIISRFIVRMHPFIHDNLYWRNGVYLKYGDNIALIKADVEDRKIFLSVTGSDETRRDFFSKLLFQIESIHKTIPRLVVKTKIPIPNHPNILVDYDHLMRLADMGETTFIPEGLKERVDIWKLLGGFRKDFYKRVKGIDRLRYLDKLSLIATILGFLIALATIIFQIFPQLISIFKSSFNTVSISLVSLALASPPAPQPTQSAAPIEAKAAINIGIMVCIIIAFIWTLAISLHGESNSKVQRASDINKMLLGFLIGSAKSFMGL